MEGTQHFSVFVFVLHGLFQSNFSLSFLGKTYNVGGLWKCVA